MNFFNKIQNISNISRELLQKTYRESMIENYRREFILEKKATIKFEKRYIPKIKRNLMKVASRGCSCYTFSIEEYPTHLSDEKIVEVLKKHFPDLKIFNRVISEIFFISWE